MEDALPNRLMCIDHPRDYNIHQVNKLFIEGYQMWLWYGIQLSSIYLFYPIPYLRVIFECLVWCRGQIQVKPYQPPIIATHQHMITCPRTYHLTAIPPLSLLAIAPCSAKKDGGLHLLLTSGVNVYRRDPFTP